MDDFTRAIAAVDDSALAVRPFAPVNFSAAAALANVDCSRHLWPFTAGFWMRGKPSSWAGADASYLASHCSNYSNWFANVLPSVSSVTISEWTEFFEKIWIGDPDFDFGLWLDSAGAEDRCTAREPLHPPSWQACWYFGLGIITSQLNCVGVTGYFLFGLDWQYYRKRLASLPER